MMPSQAEQILRQGCKALPFAVDETQLQQLQTYLGLLNRWNNVHNLTAVRDEGEQVRVHLLDCLAVVPYIPLCKDLADIGSGAGLPALVIAIMKPQIQVIAVESNHKKTAFMRHAVATLGLANVSVVSARVEQWQPENAPDVVISRALAAPQQLLELTGHLGHAETRWLLMCGHAPDTPLQKGFIVLEKHKITVPLLAAARSLLVIGRSGVHD